METFRSEDINSILALPAIYSGDFQSESRGEQCASVSGSLLNGLDLDTSARRWVLLIRSHVRCYLDVELYLLYVYYKQYIPFELDG